VLVDVWVVGVTDWVDVECDVVELGTTELVVGVVVVTVVCCVVLVEAGAVVAVLDVVLLVVET